jgi:DNA-binding transcriptional LysR family regulator
MSRMDMLARRVTLRELRLLLAVSRSGSILKAAGEIGLTQPALSKSIADLEGTFGVRLFDRTNRGVIPTPHGEVLIRRATGIFDELRRAVDELGSLTDANHGELRIGGTPTMCAGLLPRVISSVRGNRPRFQFHVAELESGKLASEVVGRSLDLGLSRGHAIGDNDHLAFERLFDDRLFIVAGAQHPLAGRRSITLEETARHQWVLPATDGSVTAQLKGEFRRQRLDFPEAAATTMSMLVRYELIATNSFLTVMYGSVLRFGSASRSLRVLPVDLPSGIPIGIVHLKNRTLTPAAEVFIQAIREMVRPMHSVSAKYFRRERP